MPFVKLDCGILNSTLWIDHDARDVFITALLMAEPIEITQPAAQIAVDKIELTGWSAPPGWYGFVPAASVGIVRRSGVDMERGLQAVTRLGEPDQESRTPDHEGRRMIRIDGGFLILNYFLYRDRDYSTAERSKRYRERKKAKAASRVTTVTTHVARDETVARPRDITQAEAEAEAESISLATDPFPNTDPCSAQPAVATRKKLNGKNPKRGTLSHFVPEAWDPTDADIEWARREFPTLDLRGETEKFTNYEFSKPRSDWTRAWKVWLRSAANGRSRPIR